MPEKFLALFYSYIFLQWSLKVRQELVSLLSSPSSKKDNVRLSMKEARRGYYFQPCLAVLSSSCRLLTCRLSGVGWSGVSVSGCFWLSGVGCRVMTVDCRVSRVSLSVNVVGSWL
jgi:hypothetical protein